MQMHQDASLKRPVLLFSMAALGPETIIQLGPIPITNTVLATILVDAFLLGSAIYLKKHLKKIPGTFQNLFEFVVDSFYNLTETIAGKNAAKIFPWFLTFFLFILISNWSGLIPGHGSVGFAVPAGGEAHAAESSDTHAETAPSPEEHTETDTHAATTSDEHAPTTQPTNDHATATAATETKTTEETAEHEEAHLIPVLRNPTSDLNVTLALALISLVATHTLAIRSTGVKDYLSRFFSLNPILLFVGLLEIVSEFVKIISLSFRLFGNIFAGEVVLATISDLFAFVFPVPFIMLEVIVGLVQALVFSMLTMVFMSVLMTPHHAEEHAKEVNH